MALTWNWSEKIGEAVFCSSNGDEWTLSLYQGNAFLIFIDEYEVDGEQKYSLCGFFCDEQHVKNCFGLNKRGGFTDNLYAQDSFCLDRITLYKDRYRYTEKLVSLIVKAFDSVNIQISNYEFEFGSK